MGTNMLILSFWKIYLKLVFKDIQVTVFKRNGNQLRHLNVRLYRDLFDKNILSSQENTYIPGIISKDRVCLNCLKFSVRCKCD